MSQARCVFPPSSFACSPRTTPTDRQTPKNAIVVAFSRRVPFPGTELSIGGAAAYGFKSQARPQIYPGGLRCGRAFVALLRVPR